MRRSRLEVAQVLAWAEAHRRRTGAWPRVHSGPVAESPGETWRRIDSALRYGLRGLEGGSSLARLLEHERGIPARRGRKRSARAYLALRLRAQGLSLAEVGRRLGVSWQSVWQMLRRLAAGQRPDGAAPVHGRRSLFAAMADGLPAARARERPSAQDGRLHARAGYRVPWENPPRPESQPGGGMTPHELQTLEGQALNACCAELVMGWDGRDPAHAAFRPAEDLGQALQMVGRLAAADLVLHRYAGDGQAGAFWMAWFGDGAQATAPTAALAVSRAALLYVLDKGRPRAAGAAAPPVR
jgi:hypothetical protein